MKIVALSFVILAVSTVFGDDFVLNDGKEYKAVKVSRVEPDGLVVTTAYGIIKLFFTDLPKEIREKYHYDPKKAEAFRFRLDAARDAAADEVSAAAEVSRRERENKGKSSEASAKPPSPPSHDGAASSLSLEAHEIGTADAYQSYWETDSGSYDREYARGKRILVTIHDISRKVSKCQIDVYFIARPLFQPSTHFIYEHRRLFPRLRGRLEIKSPVAARTLHTRMVNLPALGRSYGSGADMDGWIVAGQVDDRVFGVCASSQTLLAIARNDPRKAETLSHLIEHYNASQR